MLPWLLGFFGERGYLVWSPCVHDPNIWVRSSVSAPTFGLHQDAYGGFVVKGVWRVSLYGFRLSDPQMQMDLFGIHPGIVLSLLVAVLQGAQHP